MFSLISNSKPYILMNISTNWISNLNFLKPYVKPNANLDEIKDQLILVDKPEVSPK